MTDAQFIDAVRNLVKERAQPKARTKSEVRRELVEEGIITNDGKLAREYGGVESKATRKVREAA